MKMKKTVYEIITDQILQQLESGTIPWKKPWNRTGNVEYDWPKNLASKKPYTGINVFILSCAPFSSPFWLTFKQTQALGGNIKKGQKGYPVIFWKMAKKQKTNEETGEKETFIMPILRYYTVFNVDQCENIDPVKIPSCPDEIETIEFSPIETAQAIVDGMPSPPEINHLNNYDRACYSPSLDKISLPAQEQFKGSETYYSTLFHELSHSTGHANRLDRKEMGGNNFFGSHDYSKEELVAEFSAAFLCGVSGISQTTIDNSAAYINGWSKKLRSNPKWAVYAAAAAQKSADLIRGIEKQEYVAQEQQQAA